VTRLSGRVALVTGAGSGVGRAVSARFLAEGARVCAFDLRPEGLVELVMSAGTSALAVAGDVRSSADLDRAVDATVEAFGRLDVLVANAGIHDGDAGLTDLSAETLERLFDEVHGVNVKGAVLAVRAALEHLMRARGTVIMTTSISSERPGFGGVAYVSSKHAVAGLVRQLAWELAPFVRVNAIQLGYVATGLRSAEVLGGAGVLPPAADVATRVPLERTPELAALTEAFVLLAGDGAGAFMTGAELAIDSGQRLGGPPARR